MNTQAIIENLLDMWLSTKQLHYIAENWKAFYTDPLRYKNSIVIDMVKMDLSMQ